jgi:hypothetical protein
VPAGSGQSFCPRGHVCRWCLASGCTRGAPLASTNCARYMHAEALHTAARCAVTAFTFFAQGVSHHPVLM